MSPPKSVPSLRNARASPPSPATPAKTPRNPQMPALQSPTQNRIPRLVQRSDRRKIPRFPSPSAKQFINQPGQPTHRIRPRHRRHQNRAPFKITAFNNQPKTRPRTHPNRQQIFNNILQKIPPAPREASPQALARPSPASPEAPPATAPLPQEPAPADAAADQSKASSSENSSAKNVAKTNNGVRSFWSAAWRYALPPHSKSSLRRSGVLRVVLLPGFRGGESPLTQRNAQFPKRRRACF